MSLLAKHLGGTTFEVSCRSHTLVIDQPPQEGGSDKGMTPVELFNASLTTCIACSAVAFLARRIPDLQGLTVKADWQYADNPHRVVAVHIRLLVPRELADPEVRGLQRTIQHCTVSNTLKGVPKIDIAVDSTK